MSLINDMLKDLEARGGNDVATGRHVRANTHTTHTGSRWQVRLLAGLVVILAAGMTFLLLRESPAPAPGTSRVEAATVNEPAPALPEDENSGEPGIATEPRDSSGELIAVVKMPAAAGEPAAINDTEPDASVTPAEALVKAQVEEEAAAGTARPDTSGTPVEEARAQAPKTIDREETDGGSVIVRRHEPSADEKARRAGRDGLAALHRGDWASAARLLEEVIEHEPANDDAREGLAVALERQGRLSEAEGVLLDGLAVAANPARFAKLRARQLAARKDLEGAVNALSIAVPPVADDPEYHALKGALAHQAAQYTEAADTYLRLTALEPANGTWQAGLGMALDRLNDHDGAQAAYERALDAGGLERTLAAHVQRRLIALDANASGAR